MLALEANLERLAFLALQQAGVFGRHHAPKIATLEAVGEPAARRGQLGVMLVRRVKARHVAQRQRSLLGHRQMALACWRGQQHQVRVQFQGVGGQRNGVPESAAGPHHRARHLKRRNGREIQLLGHPGREQHLAAQCGLGPAHVPVVAQPAHARASKRIEVAVLAKRQEHRSRRAFAHGWQPVAARLLAQQAEYIAVLCVRLQFGVHHRAALPQMRDKAPQPLEQCGLSQPLGTELLAQLWRQCSGHLLQQRQR